jgi:hypothetical protein
VEAGFALEPLPGEAGVYGGAGGGADTTEGEVGGGPGFGACGVGAEDGAANVIGAEMRGDAALDHGEGGAV